VWIANVAHNWCCRIDLILATFICWTTVTFVRLFPLQDTSSTVQSVNAYTTGGHLPPCCSMYRVGCWNSWSIHLSVGLIFTTQQSDRPDHTHTHTHTHTLQFTVYRILNNICVHTGRMDGPVIEPQWGPYFSYPRGPASLLYSGYWFFDSSRG